VAAWARASRLTAQRPEATLARASAMRQFDTSIRSAPQARRCRRSTLAGSGVAVRFLRVPPTVDCGTRCAVARQRPARSPVVGTRDSQIGSVDFQDDTAAHSVRGWHAAVRLTGGTSYFSRTAERPWRRRHGARAASSPLPDGPTRKLAPRRAESSHSSRPGHAGILAVSTAGSGARKFRDHVLLARASTET
jgi:hypothetical protein